MTIAFGDNVIRLFSFKLHNHVVILKEDSLESIKDEFDEVVEVLLGGPSSVTFSGKVSKVTVTGVTDKVAGRTSNKEAQLDTKLVGTCEEPNRWWWENSSAYVVAD